MTIDHAPLARYTRFAIGGPADRLIDTNDESVFIEALRFVAQTKTPHLVIGGGTNLVVSDEGFRGVVLRYTGSSIERHGIHLRAQAGAVLQAVVDASIAAGLEGIATMTGIPGYLGGAIYGNAGAYGDSIENVVESVRVFAEGQVVPMTREQCQFAYRESIFKKQKEWVILSADLRFTAGDTKLLADSAHRIRQMRDAKYPPDMKCAGSIFKNIVVANLPAATAAQVPSELVRGGKVPSAWFLEQAGVKGMRLGDIQVAEYHANLIYNDGHGTASDLVTLIAQVKERVHLRFGFELDEEVQYVGFNGPA